MHTFIFKKEWGREGQKSKKGGEEAKLLQSIFDIVR
jgi:hypothetical protein